jgi:hypothetical protein
MKTRDGFVSNSSSTSFTLLIKDDVFKSLKAGDMVICGNDGIADTIKLDKWELMLFQMMDTDNGLFDGMVLGDIRSYSWSTMDMSLPVLPKNIAPELLKELATETAAELVATHGECTTIGFDDLCHCNGLLAWDYKWEKMVNRLSRAHLITQSSRD